MPYSSALDRTRTRPGVFWMPQQPTSHKPRTQPPAFSQVPPLTAKERGELRTLLLERRQERLDQLEALDDRPIRNGVVDLGHRQTVRNLLSDIELALSRLDRGRHGRYGRCETCGERIPYGVLRVLPYARSCDTCLVG